MFQPDGVHSLTDFKRRTAEFHARLRKSGLPEVLTVEGRPALIVQDARAYQRLLDQLDRAEAVEAVKRGLASMKRGRGKPSGECFASLRRELGLSATRRR